MKPWHLYIAMGLLSLLPLLLGNRYIYHVATMITIMAPMALSMGLMIRVGQLSLAQSAFMGIGAYASALLSLKLGLPPVLAFVAGGVISACFALLLGPVFLRIKGVFFVLLTFAFGQIIFLTLQDWTSLTGGNGGLVGIPKFTLFGFRLRGAQHFYWFGLGLTLCVYFGLRLLERSRVGTIFRAMEENDMLCRSMGSNVLKWRLFAFALSAFVAGLSGSLYAFYIGFLSPDAFGFRLSVDLIVMNVIGGSASFLGPLIGALVIVPLPEVLRDMQEFQLMLYAISLILFLLFARRGLVSLLLKDKP